MDRSRRDHKDWLKDNPSPREARSRSPDQQSLRMIEQASVSVSAMTGNPDWDRFLSYLQRGVEISQQQADGVKERLCDPGVYNAESIIGLKIALAAAEARTQAWQAAINLPRDIIENGDKAAELIVEDADAGEE
jgi:hypothetical protein